MIWNDLGEIAKARVEFGPAPQADATPDARSLKRLDRLEQLIERAQARNLKVRYLMIRDYADQLWRAQRRAILWRRLRRWLKRVA
jgi:hypothetical protein